MSNLSSALVNESLSPVMSTAEKTTRPTPIISAAAVRAVRAALRTALSRASAPLARHASGAPTTVASSGTAKRAVIATARKTRIAPNAIPSRRWLASPEPATPFRISATPPSAKSSAMYGVNRARRPRGSVAPSRRPAIGGILVARTAGMSAETSVTPKPTRRPRITPVEARRGEVVGSPKPTAPKSAMIPAAISRPRKMPATVPRVAVTSASTMTLERICRRLAPSVRSIAISRMRWATVIENMLKIGNAPTSTDTPPNASSAGPRKPLIWSEMSLESAAAFSSPVCDLEAAAERRAHAVAQLGVRDAGIGLEVDLRQLAREAVPALGVGERDRAHERTAERGTSEPSL